MGSWWCGKGVSFDLCDDLNGYCGGKWGRSGTGNARSPWGGARSYLMGVRLRPYDPTVRGAAVLFFGRDCKEAAGRLDADEDPTKSADYTKDMMWDRNIWQDSISSVMVPQGYSLEIFKNDGFTGGSTVISGKEFTDD